MRRFRGTLITFVVLMVASVGFGLLMKGRYQTIDLNQIDFKKTDIPIINVVESFYNGKDEYNVDNLMKYDVVKVKVLEKTLNGNKVVAVAEVQQVYAGKLQVGKQIEILEHGTVSRIDGQLKVTDNFMNCGLVQGETYLVALKPSSLAFECYEFAYHDFSFLMVANQYLEKFLNDNATLSTYDEDGNVLLYFLAPDANVDVLTAFYPEMNLEKEIDEFNAFGQNMVEAFQGLMNQ